jgi:hypothetical protein
MMGSLLKGAMVSRLVDDRGDRIDEKHLGGILDHTVAVAEWSIVRAASRPLRRVGVLNPIAESDPDCIAAAKLWIKTVNTA